MIQQYFLKNASPESRTRIMRTEISCAIHYTKDALYVTIVALFYNKCKVRKAKFSTLSSKFGITSNVKIRNKGEVLYES